MSGFLGSPPRSPARRRFAPRSPQRSIRFALRCFTLLEDDGIAAPEIDDVADASIDEDADEARDDATARDAVGEESAMTDEDPHGLASATWDAALQRYQRETSATEDGNDDPAIASYGESDAGSSSDNGSRINNREDNAAEVTKDLLRLERDSEFEHFSLHVEMAKGAFLRNPCEERWEDLVHSFQVEMWRRMDGVHNSQMEVLQRLEMEEADEPSGMVIGAPGGAEDAIMEEGENESEVSAPSSEFGDNATNMQLNEMSSVGAPKSGNAPAIHDTASVEVDPPLGHVANGSISSEEMAMRQLPDDDAFADFSGDDDCWVERDVSMSVSLSSEDKTVEEGASKQTPSQETSPEETATKTATEAAAKGRRKFNSPCKLSTNKVLAEVLHWEKQIERYDQRYVAVVAAALDETQGVAWKEGQIMEVVPSAWAEEMGAKRGTWEGPKGEDEEILYVV